MDPFPNVFSILISFLLVLFFQFRPVFADNNDLILLDRCFQIDSGLDETQGKGRWEWVLKCVPGAQKFYDNYKVLRYSGGNSRNSYPTLGIVDKATGRKSNPKNYRAPFDPKESCSSLPPGYEIAHICISGCFTPTQLLTTHQGLDSISQLFNHQQGELLALDESSALDRPQFEKTKIEYFVQSPEEEIHQILIFKTEQEENSKSLISIPWLLLKGLLKRQKTFKKETFSSLKMEISTKLSPLNRPNFLAKFGI